MSEIRNPLDVAQRATADYQTCYGSDLVAVLLYGSAAGKEFDSKRSDINLLIILKSLTPALVAKSRNIQRAWLKKRFALPLFMDRNYVERSLDSFPIEFLALREQHSLLCGKDVLEDLPIARKDIRVQVERELKGKWLHLLREWPMAVNDPHHLERLIRLSLKDFAVLFGALLFLKDLPAPAEHRLLFGAVTAAYGLAGAPFEAVMEAHRSRDKAAMLSVFDEYVGAIQALINAIDDLEV